MDVKDKLVTVEELGEAIQQTTACKIVTGTMSIAVPNSGTVAADFTGLVPSDYKVRSGLFMMSGYQLPYLNGGTYTFVRTITNEGVVTIDNTVSGWGTQTVSAVLFLVKR